MIEVIDYTDCFVVSVFDKQYVFDGFSEPQKMLELLEKIGEEPTYTEIGRPVVNRGNRFE